MSPEVKDRLQMVMNLVKVSFHWGYIPVVLYFGKHAFRILSNYRVFTHITYNKMYFT